MRDHNYFVYIITNQFRTTLYTGMTNDLEVRMKQHYENIATGKVFAGQFRCCYLLYFERFSNVNHAIEREKQIKKYRREKKERLINKSNFDWSFLNKPETGELDYDAIDEFLGEK